MAGSSAITALAPTATQLLVWDVVVWLDRLVVIPLAVALVIWLVVDLRAAGRERGRRWLLALLAIAAGGALLRLGVAADGLFHDAHRGYALLDGWLQAFDHPFGERPVVRTRYGPGATAIYALLLQLPPGDETALMVANAVLSSLVALPVALVAAWLLPWRHTGLLAAGLYAIWPAGVRLAPSEDCSNLALVLAWSGLWLIASMRRRPSTARLWAAMLAISLAVQSRDSLQPLALMAIGLAILHLGASLPARTWWKLGVGALAFNAAFLWLFFTLIVPDVARVDGFSVASQARYWTFWGWTPANPIFDPALTPLLAIGLGGIAILPARWLPVTASPAVRRLLWLLVAWAALGNGVANLKSMSRTDAFMFHVVYVPALFVIAEIGLARLLASKWGRGRWRLASVAVATALCLAPQGWRTVGDQFIDQQEWRVYRQAVDAVPRGCTLVHPMREDFASYYHGIAHEPWLGRSRGLRMRSLGWLLSGGLHRGEGASNRHPVRERVGGCVYYLETLACYAKPPRELTDLALLRKRLDAEAGALPPRGIRTLLENFAERDHRSLADFRQPICDRVRAAANLQPLGVQPVRGSGRGNSFIVAASPQIGLYRVRLRDR